MVEPLAMPVATVFQLVPIGFVVSVEVVVLAALAVAVVSVGLLQLDPMLLLMMSYFVSLSDLGLFLHQKPNLEWRHLF